MAMIFEELDRRLGKGFVIAAVELHSGLVYYHFPILYHMNSDILPGVQAESTGNGNVGPNGISALPVISV